MKYLLYTLLITFSTFAQLKGEVFDAETRKPIPYVNIWVEDEQVGTNSEENGSFALAISEEKNIVFSSLGYETKTISSKEITKVYLKPTTIFLNEIVLEKPKKTKEIEIGDYEKSGFRWNEPYDYNAVFFQPKNETEKYPFLKEIVFQTISEIDNAKIKVRLVDINDNNQPGSDLLSEEIIVTVKKGSKENKVDVSEYNFKIPEKGFYVVIEKLLIEENKFYKEPVVHYKKGCSIH